MSEMKIPIDSLSVHPKTSAAHDLTEASSPSHTSPIDSLEAYALSSEEMVSIQKTSDAPELQKPEVYTHSIRSYLEAISGAQMAFKLQLMASDQIDFSNRKKLFLNATYQTQGIQKVLDQRAQAIKTLESDSQVAFEELKKQLNEMKGDAQKQQELIDRLNRGNLLEQQNETKLDQAYALYLSQLKSLGVIDKGDGTYDVPKESQEQFEAFSKDYHEVEKEYNLYRQKRNAEIANYNAATAAYNARADQLNQRFKQLMSTYDVSSYLKELGMTFPIQKAGDLRDPTKVEKIENLSIPNTVNVTLEGVYKGLYQQQITEKDREIAQLIRHWQLNQNQVAMISEPILNSKPLAERIFPEGFDIEQIKDDLSTEDLSSLSQDAILLREFEAEEKRMAVLLGKKVLKRTVDNLELKQEIKEEITKKLLLFSLGLLGTQSIHAFFASLSPMTQSLASLSPDSPAFALLFAFSFSNRIQENVGLGVNKEVLKTFLEEIPELAGATPEEISQLEAGINLGQLGISIKLLETSLGLPGLAGQLLAPLSSFDLRNITAEGAAEKQHSFSKMASFIEKIGVEKGYSQEEARFLSEVRMKLVEQGSLSPSASSIPNRQAVQSSFLIDSVKAALVLSKMPLENADALAKQAVENTMDETPYSSMRYFRSSLERHLEDLGIRDQAKEIASQAIVLPPQEVALLAPSLLSTSELAAIVEKRSLQLLGPQLGMEKAKEVVQSFLNNLFEQNQSFSLFQVLRTELQRLDQKEEKNRTDATTETFKETVQSMESFASFALKLMNPAYLFVYTGIIYADQGKKKPLDIMI